MRVSSLVRFAALTGIAFLGITSAATAVAPESLLGCDSEAKRTASQADGSMFVLGSTKQCVDGSDAGIVAVRLAPDGSVDETWADGGVHGLAILGDPTGFANVGGKLVYSDPASITRLDSTGQPDPGFGTGGTVSVSSALDGNAIKEVELDSQGRAVVLADDGSGITLARYAADGTLDESFGVDGTARPVPQPPTGTATELAIDGEDRIVVAGQAGQYGFQVGVMRLLTDGTADTGFGTSGDGFALTDIPTTSEGYELRGYDLAQLQIGPEDQILVSQSGFYDTYSFLTAQVGLDSAGVPAPGLSRTVGTEISSYAPLGSVDDLVVSGNYGGRHPSVNHFVLTRIGTSEWIKSFWFTPGESIAMSPEYLPAQDQIVGVGNSLAPDCYSEDCPSRRFMAIAKVDAQTGDPVESFGAEGKVLIPDNRCFYEPVPDAAPTTWHACQVKRPVIGGSAALKNHRKPVLTARISLKAPPARPVGMAQRVTVTLPKGIRLKRRLNPGNTFLGVRFAGRHTSSTKVKGRTVSFYIEPARPFGMVPNLSPEFQLKVKRGALAGWKKGKRPGNLRLKVTARYEPLRLEQYYTPNQSGTTIPIQWK